MSTDADISDAHSEMLEALNDSDVVQSLGTLANNCLDSTETAEDFRAELNDMIRAASALLTQLRALDREAGEIAHRWAPGVDD